MMKLNHQTLFRQKLRITWAVKSHLRKCMLSSNANDGRKESSWKDLYKNHVYAVNERQDKSIASYYSPSEVENGYCRNFDEVQDESKKTFSMVLPPPNVTGSLHLGHALTLAIQDAIMLWNQMNGRKINWIPGCDHAGIATQVRVEQLVTKSKQIHRHEIPPAELLRHILDWKSGREEAIFQQILSLGSSLNFKKSYFTLDDRMSKAVVEAFVRLYDTGLIYRKSRLVNWCCFLRSTISDIEVDHVAIDEPKDVKVPGYDDPIKFGYLYHFAYKVEESDSEIVVATTRPETMLGDTAVAVHPDDEKYRDFHGKYLRNPFTHTVIPVILDESVDRQFGSGAVKITPAHDVKDYDLGLKHKLDFKNVFDDEGKMKFPGTEFAGQKRFVARGRIIEALERLNLLRQITPHKMTIPTCARSGDVIEFFLKPQWYLRCNSMAQKAIESVQTGKLQLMPKHHEAVWFNWLKNSDDWCISRQIMWGHRIPAYKVIHPALPEDTWVCGKDAEDAKQRASKLCEGIEIDESMLEQDADVLDTWFSSALIPAVAFGWPDVSAREFCDNYPLSLMETGCDILFFWVIKMVMLCQELTGQLPFDKVLLHGIVVDKDGKKMSKSLGNVIDPEDVTKGATLGSLQSRVDESVRLGYMNDVDANKVKKSLRQEFPKGMTECGSDGLRYFLLSQSAQHDHICINNKAMLNSRQFASKVWQISRFAKAAYDANPTELSFAFNEELSIIERWMLHETAKTVIKTRNGFEKFELQSVCGSLNKFWMNSFSGTFLECVKAAINGEDVSKRQTALGVMLTCLRTGLRCSTPIIPYVCNALHGKLPKIDASDDIDDVRRAKYPEAEHWENFLNYELADEIRGMLNTVRIIRELKREANGKVEKVKTYIEADETYARYSSYLGYVKTLTRIANIDLVNSQAESPLQKNVLTSETDDLTVHLNMIVTPQDIFQQCQHLRTKIFHLEKKLNELETVFNSPKFQKKASEKVRSKNRDECLKIRSDIEGTTKVLENLINL